MRLSGVNKVTTSIMTSRKSEWEARCGANFGKCVGEVVSEEGRFGKVGIVCQIALGFGSE
jgi:hypothetical protein